MNKNDKALQNGVTDAFGFYLSQHPISVPETIETAIKSAFEEWLSDHTEELIAAIAARTAGASEAVK